MHPRLLPFQESLHLWDLRSGVLPNKNFNLYGIGIFLERIMGL
jgi:hypothetical protein